MSGPDVVVPANAETGEGPVWDHRTGELVWVDIPAGVLRTVEFPVAQPSCPAFGEGSTLYVTTGWEGLPDRASQPLAGSVFALDAGVSGVPPGVFRTR
jgi:sugar lactone lactonase YvrE